MAVSDVAGAAFTLTATWQKSAAKIHAADLQAQFGYEIAVTPPPGGPLGVPTNGTTTLTGGAEPAAAAAATATVPAGG